MASHSERASIGALLALVLTAFASPGAAQELLHCQDAQGRSFVTPAPCPAGSTYLGRHAPKRGGEAATEGAQGTLDPTDAARVARAVRAARFKRAMAALGTLRVYALAHYQESGEWPTQPGQLGLDADTLFNEDIARVEFRSDGTIEAQLRPDFGENKHIWLHPKPVLGGAQIRWDCRTDLKLPKQPGMGAADCRSTARD